MGSSRQGQAREDGSVVEVRKVKNARRGEFESSNRDTRTKRAVRALIG